MLILIHVCLLALICPLFPAQDAASSPAFEAASVKPAAPRTGERFRSSMGGDPGRIDYRNVSVQMMMAKAYAIEEDRIAGPDWIATAGFDVIATYPANTPKDQMNLMLRTLLEERFHVASHREPRERDVYALVIAKNGPKLAVSKSNDPFYILRGGHLEAQAYTISGLINALSIAVDRPIVDQTGLTGAYDITLDFEFDRNLARLPVRPGGGGGQTVSRPGGTASSAASETTGLSIFSALQAQLGLKLEPRKLPLETLIVDHADRTPIEN